MDSEVEKLNKSQKQKLENMFYTQSLENMQNEENFAISMQWQSPAQESEDNNQEDYLRALSQFLDENQEAKAFETELKEQALKENRIKNPFEDAWAKVVLSHLKENKTGDPIINQYVLSKSNYRKLSYRAYQIKTASSHIHARRKSVRSSPW